MADSSDHYENMPTECSDWLVEHPDEDRAALEKVWRLAGAATPPFKADPGKVDRMREVLQRTTGTVTASSTRVVRLRPVIRWKIAAVILVIAGSVWLLYPVQRSAGPGELLSVELPDGSHVRLNSGSSISYRRLFEFPSRRVSLDGEAFFDVTSGSRTFVVETFNSRISVVGTRFNVRARAGELARHTQVVVEEGVVVVTSATDPSKSARLARGESAVLRDGVLETSPVESSGVSGGATWRSGGMAFSDIPLGDLLSEIERRFNTVVTVTPDSLRRLRVSLFATEARDAGTVLEMISESHGLSVKGGTEGFEVGRK